MSPRTDPLEHKWETAFIYFFTQLFGSELDPKPNSFTPLELESAFLAPRSDFLQELIICLCHQIPNPSKKKIE